MMVAYQIAWLLSSAWLLVPAGAFVVQPACSTRYRGTNLYHALPWASCKVDDLINTSSHGVDATLRSIPFPSNLVSEEASLLATAGEGLKTIAIVATGILFAAAGALYLISAIIVPKAAEQLEKEARELAPEIWKEYEAKLNEGETLVQRPELMKELGDKIQPLIEQRFAREQQAQGQAATDQTMKSVDTPQGIVDVEIVETDKNSKS